MKTKYQLLSGFALAVLSTFNLQPSTAFAQGSLTPPGPPAPTMKSLDQIEARTPISSVPFIISQSGSYYLTTNVTVTVGDAITITTDDVTLDLNGFTISSTAPAAGGTGVLLGGVGSRSDIRVFNGHIKSGVTNNAGFFNGSGFGSGIAYSGGTPQNIGVNNVSVRGCLNDGINLGIDNSTTVESCQVQTAGGNGILASTVYRCSAFQCGNIGIVSITASDCTGNSIGNSGYGLDAFVAHNCYGEAFGLNGIGLYAAASAENCDGYGSGYGYGIQASIANSCYGYSSTNAGLYADTAINCEGRSAIHHGIQAGTAHNCYGVSSSSGGAGDGVHADLVASDCYGAAVTGDGVFAFTAQDCYGASVNGFGVYAYDLAISSYGTSTNGYGLRAFIANSCDGSPQMIQYKYNMP